MTVSVEPSRVSRIGNGVTTVFNFPYYFQSKNDLKLILVDTTTTPNTLTPLVLNTDYTLAGAVTPNFGYENGANATVPGSTTNVPAVLPATSTLVMYRDPVELQNLSLPASTPYPPQPTESGLDAIVLMMQRLKDWLSRATTLPDGFAGTFNPQLPVDLPGAANAGCTLVTDPTGTKFIVGPVVASGGASSGIVVNEIDVMGGNQNFILPSAALSPGAIIAVLNPSFGSANHVNVSATGGDLIMGQATDVVAAGETKMYWSDSASNWYLIN